MFRRGSEVAHGANPASRAARRLVAILFAALLIPGLVGFDLWPLTGWRLFSLSLDDTLDRWVLEAIDEDGSSRFVSPEELPLGYRHAEWPMRGLADAPTERREAMCTALAAAVVTVDPTVVELRIAEDEQRLVERNGTWTVEHDLVVNHTCSPPGSYPSREPTEAAP